VTELGQRDGGGGHAAEPVAASEDPNAPIIVDAPPEVREFGVVELKGSRGGKLWELLDDLGFLRFWP
jgi:hypothetical protein